MKKYISLGVNNIPKYLYYLPLLKWAWKQFEWETHIFFTGPSNSVADFVDKIIDGFDGCIHNRDYSTETVAQVSRMYLYDYVDDASMIMTSDADIIPLSNYWLPKTNEITCYGRDLSSEHQPMCYVAMSPSRWKLVMNGDENPGLLAMFWDLDFSYPKAKNKWCVDQDILTEHLNWFKEKTHINRGIDKRTGYPIGRVDRSNWTLDHRQFIDAHLPHDTLTNDKSFHNVMQLLHTVWPKEDWKWFLHYTKEFKKLL